MDELPASLEAVTSLDPLALLDLSLSEDAPLSRFERLAVRLGAWAGGVAERWAFSSGPFFAFDGRLAAQYGGCQDDQRPTPDA
jgi:hypothetical protein